MLLVTLGSLLAGVSAARADLVNPGFEYGLGTINVADFPDASITPAGGWFTTEADHAIEVWGSGWMGVPAFAGTDFVELNANAVDTLYQDASGIAAGSQVGFSFAHRGREGVDTMRLVITDLGADGKFGTADDTTLFSQLYSDDNTAWGAYMNTAPITALGNTIRVSYESISAAGGNPTVGNFLDEAHFGVGVGAVTPLPSTALAGLVLLGGVAGVQVRRRKTMRSLSRPEPARIHA
jgi:hypothetical protein